MLTNATLDAARLRGDAIADETVAAIFSAGNTAAVVQLLGTLMRDDQSPGALPPIVLDYLARTGQAVPRSLASVEAGELVFAEHGPEILMLLCCYSLPASYAAKKGVAVVHRTAYLAKRPNRRLFETSQFIVDVLSPAGLGPKGRGVRTSQKVRLMHAAIRHLIVTDLANPWDIAEMGVPINQEDLLGTLMTFSALILDGLARLGVALTPLEQQAFLDAWLAVGPLMGIEPDLLPATVPDAHALTALIQKRQIAESQQGREMTAALLGMMQSNVPKVMSTVPGCLMREFLPPNVATFLGVPSHPLEQEMIRLIHDALLPLERFVDMQKRRHALARAFSLRLMQWMISVETDGRPTRFTLPESLQQAWHLAPGDSEESFWDKLVHRFRHA